MNTYVFNIFSNLDRAQNQLTGDTQRLETILMSKRKDHIEEMIPRIKDEIKSKLSFLSDLSFDEVLSESQTYGNTISEIVSKLEGLRDEYLKLASGSFDVSEFYGYLDKQLTEVENDLGQFELILRTCKMQMLAEEADALVDEGNVIINEFEQDKSSEMVLKADNFVTKASEKYDIMTDLRVSLPRRGVSKEFSNQFKDLQKQFEDSKIALEAVRDNLHSSTQQFTTQIRWINA
ncbi:MAG: hypothetical protein ACXABK_06210, partial [Candidatus Heimdallarchaeaceae archaeon]